MQCSLINQSFIKETHTRAHAAGAERIEADEKRTAVSVWRGCGALQNSGPGPPGER